jgi:hypothetical protein
MKPLSQAFEANRSPLFSSSLIRSNEQQWTETSGRAHPARLILAPIADIGTSESVTFSHLQRVFGCFLISRMPDEGLHEAIETLKETYNFYVEKSLPQKPIEIHSGSFQVEIEKTSIREVGIITES